MRKEEDFEPDEEPSFFGNIVVTVVTLVIVVLVVVGVYFFFFRGEEEAVQPQMPTVTATPVPTEASTPQPTAEPTNAPTPESTEVPTPEPVAEENPTGMGQELEDYVQEERTDVEAGHSFAEVNETITAKNATNLRNMPSQGDESQIMLTLYNGQTATRIGISDSGWSKVEYNGEIYYAVSSYLTTDLTAPTPQPEDDGIKTVFTPCDETVTPKMEVNLRTLPSVTNPESTVIVKLPYGATVKRTGINTDVGWSRVEYEGQVLYCISSYVFVVEAP